MTKSRHRRPGPAVQLTTALTLVSAASMAAGLALLLLQVAF